MTRRRNQQRRGRPYQPMPERRRGVWVMRLVIVAVAILLVLGAVAITVGQ
jgi:hypothetical protein